jgi:hypothetical protein
MAARFKLLGPTSLVLALALSAWGQSSIPRADASSDVSDQPPTEIKQQKHQPGAAREIGAGAGTVGVGAAKGAGDLAKGTAKGAGDLVTLHPLKGAGSIGKGAASAGKDVTVGTVKGTGKVGKGIGRAFKHLF